MYVSSVGFPVVGLVLIRLKAYNLELFQRSCMITRRDDLLLFLDNLGIVESLIFHLVNCLF